ncbi:YceI family protein [bacterium]|nr:YceI family protein [bacterium]
MKYIKKGFLVGLVGALCLWGSVYVSAKQFHIDPETSYIKFSIKPVGLKPVHGSFSVFEGTCDIDNNEIQNANISITLKSISTKNKTRDRHLQQKEFFNAKTFPIITFMQTEPLALTQKILVGNLTMKGVTHPVELPVTLNYTSTAERGDVLEGTIQGVKLDRLQYGVSAQKRLINRFVYPDIHVKFVTK